MGPKMDPPNREVSTRLVTGTSLADGSDKLVVGNGAMATVCRPGAALGETSKNSRPRPTVEPAARVAPAGSASASEAVSEGPVEVLMIGPNRELPLKM